MTYRAFLPMLFAFLLATCAFTACGTDDVTIAPTDGATPDTATGGDAATGSDAPQDASRADADVDAADAAVDLSKLTCEQLSASYGAELAQSRMCHVNALVNECTAPRERVLGCGCNTFVNANSVSRLDAIAAAWAAKKCVVACPASLCPVAAGGACGKDGTCADVGEL